MTLAKPLATALNKSAFASGSATVAAYTITEDVTQGGERLWNENTTPHAGKNHVAGRSRQTYPAQQTAVVFGIVKGERSRGHRRASRNSVLKLSGCWRVRQRRPRGWRLTQSVHLCRIAA
jgi:hypothetical protein